MTVPLKVPDLGESVTEASILDWHKSEGDTIEKDETVAELESDKATLDLPAPAAGRLTKITKKPGDSVEVGETIAEIETNGEAATEDEEEQAGKSKAASKRDDSDEDEGRAKAKKKKKKAKRKSESSEDAESEKEKKARKQSEEREKSADNDESEAKESTAHAEDVDEERESKDKAEAEKPSKEQRAVPSTPRFEGGERSEQRVAMTKLRRTVAARLVQAQQNAALVTTFNEVDMSDVMELRQTYRDAFKERYGVKLGFMSFFVSAAVKALQQFPEINARVDGDEIVYANYCDVGIAVSSDKGLLVPIIRNAERLNFAEIERTISDYSDRAQRNKIQPKDLEGGTFTISNGGVFGSLLSTPIINPPQSGVLGMHAIEQRPVARDGQVVIRPMMYLALTYDHRIVDGREAVTFLRRIVDMIEDPTRLALEV